MTAFNVESWIWYAFTILMVVLRITARLLHFGSYKRLQIEDWFMIWIACLYTILIAFLNVCAVTSSNLIDPNDIPSLTPQDIAERTYGSKVILVVEQCMCAAQWGTKACLLMLYWRLTENLTQAWLVKGAAIYVAVTYVVMEVLYFAVWCRPFHDYWQTPTDNVQCTTALHHLILNLAFNLSSDLLIMSIPLPLLLRQRIEITRKILLVLPFSLGFFSIICAILSKHLSFTQPFSAEWVYWYTREASTVMIVSNMPYTWGLARRIFHMNSFFGANDTVNRSRADSLALTRTRDTGIEMSAGQLREIRGVPIDVESSMIGVGDDAHRNAEDTDPRKKSWSRYVPWKRSTEKGMQQLSSTFASRDGPPRDQHGCEHLQWGNLTMHKKETEFAVDPASSGSSSAASDGRPSLAYVSTGSRQTVPQVNTCAVDKLYRLSDDDLINDIENDKKRSNAREPS